METAKQLDITLKINMIHNGWLRSITQCNTKRRKYERNFKK